LNAGGGGIHLRTHTHTNPITYYHTHKFMGADFVTTAPGPLLPAWARDRTRAERGGGGHTLTDTHTHQPYYILPHTQIHGRRLCHHCDRPPAPGLGKSLTRVYIGTLYSMSL